MRPPFMRLPSRMPSLASEAGFAVPTALLAIVAAFGLASAVVISSVGAQRGTVRDQGTKAALATAEAGIANAMLRFNRIPSETDSCAPVGGTTPDAEGWCTTTVEGGVDRGGFTYYVRPDGTELEIVSVGTVDGVVRRVNAVAASAQTEEEGLRPFGEASVVGLEGLLLNSNARIDADIATNGDIGLNANSEIECVSAQVGEGHGINPNNNGTITCDPHEGIVSLPPVNPGDVMINNANDRICNLDPLTPTSSCSSAWNPSQRTLTLNSGGALTLGASGGEFNYAFCQITLNSNSYLHIAGGAKVRIYFGGVDDGCQPGQAGEPLILNSNSKIEPTGDGAPDLAILVASDIESDITINSNAILFDCDQSFVLYAPNTNITINSKTHICGGTAGRSILVNANATITASDTASDFELPGTAKQVSLGYGPPEFVECTSVLPGPGEPPDVGC